MTREIKFRAWNGVDGGYDYFDLDDEVQANGRPIQQYTGLKDKNGKEIYEGDVLHVKNNKKNWEVQWQNYGWAVELLESGMWEKGKERYSLAEHKRILKKLVIGDYEIIGNIYENPELITS